MRGSKLSSRGQKSLLWQESLVANVHLWLQFHLFWFAAIDKAGPFARCVKLNAASPLSTQNRRSSIPGGSYKQYNSFSDGYRLKPLVVAIRPHSIANQGQNMHWEWEGF